MAIAVALPPQPVIVDSFWNLIQNSDDSVQRELLFRLQRKYRHHSGASVRKRRSDEELEQMLSEFAPITENDFPELSREQYISYAHSRSSRLPKGMEKWL